MLQPAHVSCSERSACRKVTRRCRSPPSSSNWPPGKKSQIGPRCELDPWSSQAPSPGWKLLLLEEATGHKGMKASSLNVQELLHGCDFPPRFGKSSVIYMGKGWQYKIKESNWCHFFVQLIYFIIKYVTVLPPPYLKVTDLQTEIHFSALWGHKLTRLWTAALFDFHNSCSTSSSSDADTRLQPPSVCTAAPQAAAGMLTLQPMWTSLERPRWQYLTWKWEAKEERVKDKSWDLKKFPENKMFTVSPFDLWKMDTKNKYLEKCAWSWTS